MNILIKIKAEWLIVIIPRTYGYVNYIILMSTNVVFDFFQ